MFLNPYPQFQIQLWHFPWFSKSFMQVPFSEMSLVSMSWHLFEGVSIRDWISAFGVDSFIERDLLMRKCIKIISFTLATAFLVYKRLLEWHFVEVNISTKELLFKIWFLKMITIKMKNHQNEISSRWHFFKMTLLKNGIPQNAIFSKCHFIKMPFPQNRISSKWHFF
jgi:hypothetical protein